MVLPSACHFVFTVPTKWLQLLELNDKPVVRHTKLLPAPARTVGNDKESQLFTDFERDNPSTPIE